MDEVYEKYILDTFHTVIWKPLSWISYNTDMQKILNIYRPNYALWYNCLNIAVFGWKSWIFMKCKYHKVLSNSLQLCNIYSLDMLEMSLSMGFKKPDFVYLYRIIWLGALTVIFMTNSATTTSYESWLIYNTATLLMLQLHTHGRK